MYNPEQPRDDHGRWAKTKATHSFLSEHGDELALGLALVGGAALTYGLFSVGSGAFAIEGLEPEVVSLLENASTVRKIGPVKGIEAWQYAKGFFSPNLSEHTLEEIPSGVRALRVGAEITTKKGKNVIGAAKPLFYDQMSFTGNATAAKVGAGLVATGSVAGTYSKLHKRNR